MAQNINTSPISGAELVDEASVDLGVEMANHLINVLAVTACGATEATEGVYVLFEYRYKTPTGSEWRKYATYGRSLAEALYRAHATGVRLQQRMQQRYGL